MKKISFVRARQCLTQYCFSVNKYYSVVMTSALVSKELTALFDILTLIVVVQRWFRGEKSFCPSDDDICSVRKNRWWLRLWIVKIKNFKKGKTVLRTGNGVTSIQTSKNKEEYKEQRSAHKCLNFATPPAAPLQTVSVN